MGDYDITTLAEKWVSDYSGLDLCKVMNLDIVTFGVLLRDAFIFCKMQSEDGREYLANANRLEQSSPDRGGIRAKIKKGGV